LCIGYLISKSGNQVNRLYFCDLVGAGCGCLGAVLAINCLGAVSTIFFVALIGCGSAMLMAGRVNGRIRWRYPLTAAVAAALGLGTLVKDNLIVVPFAPGKAVPRMEQNLGYSWHVLSRVDVFAPHTGYYPFGGALSRVWDRSRPPLTYMLMFQDGAAETAIAGLKDTDPRDEAILGYYLQGCGYVIRGEGEVLVIGPGGGVDVAIALHHGASRVTAVDINPRMIEYVRDTYNEFAGGLYHRDDVEVVCAEGRHFLTATDKTFDVIQLSGVDTFSSLALGAYAVSENYLYTEQALADAFDRLKDDGIVSFSRWLFMPARETLRLAVTAHKALVSRGVDRPEHHIVVLAAPAWENWSPWTETLIKLEPFTADELKVLRDWAAKRRFDIIYDPLVPYEAGGPYDRLEGAWDYAPVECARQFNEALRSSPEQLEAYVSTYPYNIKPCTDDSPFYFNYYRLSNLRHPFRATLGGSIFERLPVGLMILLAAMIQIIVLAGVLILLPMRIRTVGIRGCRGKINVLMYFAAIGLGFIAVEITLIQKLTVFLGGPVYSMAVTLFSLLVFCGIGSFAARRFTSRNPGRGGLVVLALLAAVLAATTWFINEAVPSLMALPHLSRCLAAVAALLPAGLLMGMPFPTGIRFAERFGEQLVPWAWSVNACATVFGSVGSIFLAMFTSFTTALYFGILAYLVALLSLLTAPRIQPSLPEASPRQPA
ncbi:MAG: spermine/spermidine synthase domain-containing protein, partial [Planctomycetota bacterium]